MPALDPASVARLVLESPDPEALVLRGVEEGRDVLRLGPLVVHRREPAFAFEGGDPEPLRDSTWVRLVPLDDGRTAAVLHVEDRPEEPALAPERLVGLVPAGRRDEVEAWAAAMNGHMAELLIARAAKARQDLPPEDEVRAEPVVSLPAGPGGD